MPGHRLNSALLTGEVRRSRSRPSLFPSDILTPKQYIKRSHSVLTPPPSLTPMERQFLLQLQEMDRTIRAQLARQNEKISALEAQILLRDRSIAGLTELLERLLGPSARDVFSRP